MTVAQHWGTSEFKEGVSNFTEGEFCLTSDSPTESLPKKKQRKKKQTHNGGKVSLANSVLTGKTVSRESFRCSVSTRVFCLLYQETFYENINRTCHYVFRALRCLMSVIFHYSMHRARCKRIILNFQLFIWKQSTKITICTNEFNNSTLLCRACWWFSECFDCSMVEKVFADWDELSKMLKISFVAEIHRFSLS